MDNQAVILSAVALAFLNLVTMAAGVVVYWRKGGNTASNETIDTYRSAVDAYELRLKQTTVDNAKLQSDLTTLVERHRAEMAAVQQEITNLKTLMEEQRKKFDAILTEKDKQLLSLKEILQGRNSAFDLLPKAIESSGVLSKKSEDYMLETAPKIDAIYKKIVTS